jgi:type III restriction enzyme
MKLTSSVIQKGERYKYNFELYNINYDKEQQEKESTKDHKIFDYTKEDFGLIAQIEEDDKETEYTSLSGQISSKRTLIQYNTYTVDEVINGIYEDFKNREWEGKILKLKEGEYTKNELPPKDYMKRIIKKSMNKRGIKGNRLIEKNAQRIFRSFDTLLRKKGKTTRHIRKATEPNPITTLSMDNESMAIGNLRHRSGIFYSTNFKNEIQPETLEILSDLIIKNEDSLGTNYNLFEVNEYLFKTPLDMVFVSHDPEFKFIRHLAKKENTEKMDAWIKSRDSGFYSIEYSITTSGGKHTKHPTFNPDFFIKISKNKMTYFIVIEIKSDNDDSQENKAKLKWTRQNFNNIKEDGKRYYLNGVIPPLMADIDKFNNKESQYKRIFLSNGRLSTEVQSKIKISQEKIEELKEHTVDTGQAVVNINTILKNKTKKLKPTLN